MVVTAPHLNTESEYNILRLLTGDMDHIISQNSINPIKKESLEIKNNIKRGRSEAESTNLSRIRENISKDQMREK